jgi:AsmA family protein
MPSPVPLAPRRQVTQRFLRIASGVLAALVVALGVCEWQRWPFLAGPAERALSERLQRAVTLGDEFSLRLIGPIRLQTDELRVANADWADPRTGPMVAAKDVTLRLRWRDLLGLSDGRPFRIETLKAGDLHVALERRGDGLANWQFAPPRSGAADTDRGVEGAEFGLLEVARGTVRLADEPLQLQLRAEFALAEGAGPGERTGLSARASGRYGAAPLQATLRTGSALPWLSTDNRAPAVPVTLGLEVGRAKLTFNGHVRDLLGRRGLTGLYEVSGPSLAAVGQPLRLTLPTTRPFAIKGRLAHEGTRWYTVVDRATVGESRLAGEFTFDTPPGGQPVLAGRLRGPALLLRDLGPAVGAPATATAADDDGRVLPDRLFDLPSLRAMDANIVIAIDRLELSTTGALQSIAPLSGHLVLQDGVLTLRDLDARLAQGRLRGGIRLDGREPMARWTVDLRGTGLRLEQWIRPLQRANAPPYATGLLGGHLKMDGRGRSTAELLASADGRLIVHWSEGTVSHLAVEAAGIDVAQALGTLLRGDDALRVRCGAGDLGIRDGRVVPRVLMVDTRDSTLWIEGQLSLASEQLDLTARAAPKDWSPLALRTPVRIQGRLSQPVVSLEKGPLVRRLVPAALLAVVAQPLAALLPLIDTDDDEAAKKAAAACREVAQRYQATPPTAANGKKGV